MVAESLKGVIMCPLPWPCPEFLDWKATWQELPAWLTAELLES